jgi:hypothetical protein
MRSEGLLDGKMIESERAEREARETKELHEIELEINDLKWSVALQRLEKKMDDLEAGDRTARAQLVREIAENKREIERRDRETERLEESKDLAQRIRLGLALKLEEILHGMASPTPELENLVRWVALSSLNRVTHLEHFRPLDVVDFQMALRILQIQGVWASPNSQEGMAGSQQIDQQEAWRSSVTNIIDGMMKRDPGMVAKLGVAFQDSDGLALIELAKSIPDSSAVFGPVLKSGKVQLDEKGEVVWSYRFEIGSGREEDVEKAEKIIRERGLRASVISKAQRT